MIPQPTARVKPLTLPLYLISLAVLLVSLGLLLFTQSILNLGAWFKWDLASLSWLDPLACIWPGFCDLRFPPYGFLALLAAALAAILFGVWFAYLRRPLFQTDLQLPPVTLPALQRLRTPLNSAVCLVFPSILVFILIQVIQTITATEDSPPVFVNPLVWLASLLCLLWLAWQTTTHARLRHTFSTSTFWNLTYFAALTALLVAIAAFASRRYLLLVLAGLATLGLFAFLLLRQWRNWNWPARLERAALLVITVSGFLALSYGLMSWNWAWWGENVNFYSTAVALAQGNSEWTTRLLSGTGVLGYHPVLSSAWQGLTLWLFGPTGYGWRVSNSFALALSIPFFYYFVRQLAGRGAALSAATLYGFAHVLLSINKVGATNVQAVAVMVVTFAVFLWAVRRGSFAGFVLTGVFIGLGFYTFDLARVSGVLIAIWLALYYFPVDFHGKRINWRNLAVWAAVIGAALLTALPSLSTSPSWQEQLQRTIFYSPIATTPAGYLGQFLTNSLYTFTAFLFNDQNAANVYGAHADPLTASFILLGVAALLTTWNQGWRLRLALLGSFIVFAIFAGSLQPSDYPDVTQLSALVPFYALFAALGLWAVVQLVIPAKRLQRSPTSPDVGRSQETFQSLETLDSTFQTGSKTGAVLRSTPERSGGVKTALVWVVLAITALLNIWMSVGLAQQNLAQETPAFVLQTAQMSGNGVGNGPRIFYVAYDDSWFKSLTEAHDIPALRLTSIPPGNAPLENGPVCQATNQAAIALVEVSVEYADMISAYLQQCWPESDLKLVKDVLGEPRLYRLINAGAKNFPLSAPGYWLEEEPAPVEINAELFPLPTAEAKEPGGVQEPRGFALHAGWMAAVEGATQNVLVWDPEGNLVSRLGQPFVYPSDVGFSPDGSLVVLDAGHGLYWLDAEGRVAAEATSFYAPHGLFVMPDGTVWVADTGGQRIVHVDREAGEIEQFQNLDKFSSPTSLAVAPDGRIAVGDPNAGGVYILDPVGNIQAEFTIGTDTTSAGKPGLAWLPDGSLVYTNPPAGRMVQVDPNGETIKEWTDLSLPNEVVLAPDGRLFVAEAGADRITPVEFP